LDKIVKKSRKTMKILTLVVTSILLITACSTKSSTTPIKCQNIQNEIDNLKKEKYTDTTSKVASYVVSGRYAYGHEGKKIDEKIKVLKMKLNECTLER